MHVASTKSLGSKQILQKDHKAHECNSPVCCTYTRCCSIFLAVVIPGLVTFTSKFLQGIYREVQLLP